MARTNKPKVKEQIKQTTKKKSSGPYGGWMKNPPIECIHKRKDSEGFWVETVVCSFVCKDTTCDCYVELMKDSKHRIKGEV